MIDLRKVAVCAALTLLITACDGNDFDKDFSSSNSSSSSSSSSSTSTSSSTSSGSSSSGALTGIITDGPVGGLAYETESQSGTTNAKGEFSYQEGESVVFRIGSIEFPAVEARGRVTPLDMVQAEDASLENPTVKNILRLLQSLDSDGDPDNGITITPETAEALQEAELDVTSSDFETQAASVLSTQLDLELISEDEAISHFERTLQNALHGSWVYREESGAVNVLSFLSENRYIIAHSHADDGDQDAATAEFGRYSWDPVSGEFVVEEVIRETDGSGGLSTLDSIVVHWSENTLVFETDEGNFSFDAVPNAKNSLLGAWYIYESESDNHNVLTVYEEGQYVIVHSNNQEDYSFEEKPVYGASSEWGSFTWDEDGRFTVTSILAETDGEGGLYSAEEDDKDETVWFFLNYSGVLIGERRDVDGDTDNFDFHRLGSFDVVLKDLEGDEKEVTVRKEYARYSGLEGTTWSLWVNRPGTEGVFDEVDSEVPMVISFMGEENDWQGTLTDGDAEPVLVNWGRHDNGVVWIRPLEENSPVYSIVPIDSKSGDGVLVEVKERTGAPVTVFLSKAVQETAEQ